MRYNIDFPETFELRRPVLESMSTLDDKWKLSDDGKALDLTLELASLSPHQRDIVQFARNPYSTAENIFNNLDPKTQKALAEAIYKIFG
jgi:hypothetical protein